MGLEPIQQFDTCLQSKLAEVSFRFKKNAEIIDIYQDTCEKDDERFQWVYARAVSLTNKLGNKEK